MKRLLKQLIIIIMVVFMMSFIGVFAEGIESIIPDDSIWGITMDEFTKEHKAEYKQCSVEGNEGLYVTDVNVGSYKMDVYYIFEEMTNGKGKSYAGLSKITYILNDNNPNRKTKLEDVRVSFVEEMKRIEGEPDKVKDRHTIWSNERLKIEILRGKMSKYTGRNYATVGIIFKKGSAPKPTKTPKPTNTPKPTKTPKPEYSKIDYKGVSRHPEKYDGQLVKFTGIVVQTQETSFVEYEGGSLFDKYYILRVASKYEKNKYIDGYSTDDIVYVVVPINKVEGGRILEDDKISIYGRYDGIETYTTVLGASIAIPRVEATRVVIK